MEFNKILVVDDEAPIRKMLKVGLKDFGYDVLSVSNGQEALATVIGHQPDLVILDIHLNSYPDGLEVCYRIREFSTVPIIILSVETARETKITALNQGADDYLNKPFFIDELAARIRAVLRRIAMKSTDNAAGELRVHDLIIDLVSRRVLVKGEEVHLTKTEYKLLHLLATHHGKVLTHAMIIRQVWGEDRPEHFVRVFTNTLRKKIGEDYIQTIIGVGYRFIDIPS